MPTSPMECRAAARSRELRAASADAFDLIVVGGGIFGVCVALQAARRGLRALLLEKADFGGATSWNSLRILHGGLRYLQTADLPRFRRSVREQHWFRTMFPLQTEPLAFLLPLDGRRTRRPWLMSTALRVNDMLRGACINKRSEGGLPASRVIPDPQLVGLVAGEDSNKLAGYALWYDLLMKDPPRILMGLLRWACQAGAVALNYMPATRLVVHKAQVRGIVAHDLIGGSDVEFAAPVVVNAAGPWCDWDGMSPSGKSFFTPSMACNLVLDRNPLGPFALAVPVQSGMRGTYFLVPRSNRIVLGTAHWPCDRVASGPPTPSLSQLRMMLDAVRYVLPEWSLTTADVVQVQAGYLPASRYGSARQATRPRILRHSTPKGLVTLVGEKYTTARATADRLVRTCWPGLGLDTASTTNSPPVPPRALGQLGAGPAALLERRVDRSMLVEWMAEESIHSWEDLILRRTDWLGAGGDAGDLALSLRRAWPEMKLPERIVAADEVLSEPHASVEYSTLCQ